MIRIEPRANGVLVSRAGGPRWVFAIAGAALAVVLLGTVTSHTLYAAVVAVPLALIVLLAGLAAARHRDWTLFDGRAREIVFRHGLMSIFRSASVVPFDDVEAIVVETIGVQSRGLEVGLRRAGGAAWPIATGVDRAEAGRLVAALQAVGDWPVLGDGELSAGGESEPRPPWPGRRSSTVRP